MLGIVIGAKGTVVNKRDNTCLPGYCILIGGADRALLLRTHMCPTAVSARPLGCRIGIQTCLNQVPDE